jgi:hypothetical protein
MPPGERGTSFAPGESRSELSFRPPADLEPAGLLELINPLSRGSSAPIDEDLSNAPLFARREAPAGVLCPEPVAASTRVVKPWAIDLLPPPPLVGLSMSTAGVAMLRVDNTQRHDELPVRVRNRVHGYGALEKSNRCGDGAV